MNLFLLFIFLVANQTFSQTESECLKLLDQWHVKASSKTDLVDWITNYLYNVSDSRSTTNRGGSIDLVIPNQNDPTGLSAPTTFGAKGNKDEIKSIITTQVNNNAYFKSVNNTSEIDFYYLPDIAYNTFDASCGNNKRLVSLNVTNTISRDACNITLSLPSTKNIPATIEEVDVTEEGKQSITWGKNHELPSIRFIPSTQKIQSTTPISIKFSIEDSAKSLEVIIYTDYGVVKYTKPNYKELNTICSTGNEYALELDGSPFQTLKEAAERMVSYKGTPDPAVINIFICRLAKSQYYLLSNLTQTHQELEDKMKIMQSFYADGKRGPEVPPKIIDISCQVQGKKYSQVAEGNDVYYQFGEEADLPNNYIDICKQCF
jgi:hypothetical protein